ncbi:hypothetical protein GF336_07625 [Candidatus Woesearchaeota archaeon]|nr:hypothetical protein [Candidatus Woesearchaeota archaeon]
MKFAHIADCHIGGWRDPKLTDASVKAFEKAVDKSISENVNFMIIAGDLFNTALPPVDRLKSAVQKLRHLKDNNIPVYIIPGSHDFSASGKTMIDVLAKAGLVINVAKAEQDENNLKLKFTIDKKTGTKLTGMVGKKGSLEKEYYEALSREELEKEPGYKIFLFHSALTEFKPSSMEKMDSHPLSLLPKKFNYYAGGHPHFVFSREEENFGLIAYPGPLFPNNFKEIEDLERGGFYIAEVEQTDEGYRTSITHHPIQIFNIHKIKIDGDKKTPTEIEAEIKQSIENIEFNNTVVTIRLEGILESGKPSDIDFKEIFDILYNKSAYFVMKNTAGLKTKEFEEINISTASSEDTENKLIKEHLQEIKVSDWGPETEEAKTKQLMHALSFEKQEGETNKSYETRIKQELDRIIEF